MAASGSDRRRYRKRTFNGISPNSKTQATCASTPAVQLYALLALLAALLLPSRYTRGSDLLVVAGLYVLAKVCEQRIGPFSLGDTW